MKSRSSFLLGGLGRSAPIESAHLARASALSVDSLRRAVPAEYRRWVRSAVLVCVAAYAITTLAVGLERGISEIYLRQELMAFGLSLVGLLLERRDKPMLAAFWVLFVVTAEAGVSFYLSPDGLRAAALPALPVIVIAAGLFLGPRAAYGFALGLCAWIPGLVWVSGEMGHGPGFGPRMLIAVVALFACLVATAIVLDVFLRSFGRVLAGARTNEQRAADLLAAASDGLVVVSPDGRVEASNERAASALGLAPEELTGLDVTDLPLKLVERDSGRFVLSDLTRDGASLEYRARKTGVALEARAKRVASADQRVAWLILLRDITQQLAAKEREAHLAAQLQQTQKLEAIGGLAGGVAHDFNNLLTVVAGYADFVEDLSDEGAAEIAEELRATYQRGVVLTRQLLVFARREVVAPVVLDLSEVVLGLRSLLSRLLGERIRIELSVNCVAAIEADPGEIEQVIMNLAENARDAMTGEGTLRIWVSCNAGHVILEVKDSGSGIAESTSGRIFEPFFTTKPRGKGAGLGLSTVHGIVTQSGGRIVVESKVGEGALFRIVWPRTEKPLPDSHRGSTPSGRAKGDGLILLAEDDERARRMILRMLTEAGFEVLCAQDGAEALKIARNLERAPDLLLTDIVMPGISGVELVDEIRRLHPETRYLFMSGYTDQQLCPDQHDPARTLIQKPFRRAELLERLSSLLPFRERKLA